MERPRLRPAAQRLVAMAFALLATGCSTLIPQGSPPAPVSTAAPASPPPPPTAPRVAEEVKPRVDRIADGPPNLPYDARGRRYEPQSSDVPMRQVGLASWYGEPFHGRRTATGERYDMHALTAAHRTMPLPSYARVRNVANDREIIVRVNDRGPFYRDRIIDLSRAAARKLGINGVAMVEVERLTHEEIRSGAWRKRASATALSAKPVTPSATLAQADPTP